MGKHKTERTDELRQAAKRIAIAGEVQNHIEQHNFDRLVRNGVIVEAQAENRLLNFEGTESVRPGLGEL